MTKMCDFNNPEMTCLACGYKAKRVRTIRHCGPVAPPVVIREPRPDGWQPIPLGDVVEKALTAVGITKERVEKWTRTEGQSGGCGCAARQKWLNEWGNEKQRRLRSVLLKARRFYVGS